MIYPSPWSRVREWVSRGKFIGHEDFWALRDINFTIPRGSSLGIIGVNGSGKSTLLRILSSCSHQTEGTFQVEGRMLSLLELGTGMNRMLTGRQNVLNSSRLLALPANYGRDKMEEIESFAELDEFLDRPVQLYSTGMLMRLAFSMFVAFDPDVFVVDEALSVGDIFFQQKCAKRIRDLRDRGTTLLFVSHDISAVEALCDNVLVLSKGRMRHFGDKLKGINLYYALSGSPTTATKQSPQTPLTPAPPPAISDPKSAEHSGGASTNPTPQIPLPPLNDGDLEKIQWFDPETTGRIGGEKIVVEAISLRRQDGQFTKMVDRGQDLDVFLRLRARQDVGPVGCGMLLYDRFDQLVFAQGWLNVGIDPLWLKKGDVLYVAFRLRMDVEAGFEYILAVGASEPLADPQSPTGWDQSNGGERYDLLPRSTTITVTTRSFRERRWFGPANLQISHQYKKIVAS